jgi:hypothetical protein
MIDIDLTSSAREAVVISNTPSFLLHRLLSDNAVQQASEENSPDDLLSYLERVCDNGPDSPESLTKAYVALVALAVSTPKFTIWKQALELSTDKIAWIQQIRALLDADRSASYISEEASAIVVTIPDADQPSDESWDEQESEVCMGGKPA